MSLDNNPSTTIVETDSSSNNNNNQNNSSNPDTNNSPQKLEINPNSNTNTNTNNSNSPEQATTTLLNTNIESKSSTLDIPQPQRPAAISAPVSIPSNFRNIPAGLKIVVHFRATGDAPILKKSKFQLSAHNKFHVVIEFLRKHLHSKPGDSLFLFCNAAFSPSPEAIIYDLFQCFQLNNELIINYATQDAWG